MSRQATSCCCWACVPQATVGVVEALGKFDTIAPPGLLTINCCTKQVAGVVDLKIQLMKCSVHSITKEKTSINVMVNVIHRIIPSMAQTAYYSLRLLLTNQRFGAEY